MSESAPTIGKGRAQRGPEETVAGPSAQADQNHQGQNPHAAVLKMDQVVGQNQRSRGCQHDAGHAAQCVKQ